MAKEKSNRDKIIEDMRNLLGDGMVDVELDPKHYNQGLDMAFDRFRQRSSNACLLYTSPSPRDAS